MESMEIFGQNLEQWLSLDNLALLARVIALVVIGLPVIYMLSKWIKRYFTARLSPQQGMIAGKAVMYVGVIVIAFYLLNEFGFKLAHLFAAAGIAGIALGFASQTSVSNIISGFFLIAERPFLVGDVITVGGTTGEVLSIDMISIKLRTFDNKFVRIPNETMVKAEVTNLTHFPIRRVEVTIGVAYKEDVSRVRKILLELAYNNPLCLQEPEPIIIFQEFGASSINLFFGTWTAREDYLKLKNSIQEEIKARFDAEGIEIPFPHISLYSGSASKPFPVSIVDQKTA